MLERRGFLKGLIGLAVTAPAIIRTPGLLMPVKPLLVESEVLRIRYPNDFVISQIDAQYDILTLDDYAEFVLRPMVDRFAVERDREVQRVMLEGDGGPTMGIFHL